MHGHAGACRPWAGQLPGHVHCTCTSVHVQCTLYMYFYSYIVQYRAMTPSTYACTRTHVQAARTTIKY